ncbi:hypothetical protein KP509_12G076200 [Ceratopteris richardii]|uniref:Bet v I/Major latex protein domain-containing protein n=1 Tax=Ceratopteris richardii TaxID=49495 RepID=A0A8T2TMB7_CERRI|nr:hypothetical protein KP509_12G076200 [Ceratopteris richardii]
MAQRGVEKLEVSAEVKHPADKVWKYYAHEMHNTLPVSMSGHFTDMVYLEGEPLTVGSTFRATYHEDITHYSYIKMKWDEVDHEKHHFKCSLVDGGGLDKHFAKLTYIFTILPGSSPQSCVMHFVVEYIDREDHSLHDFIKEEIKKCIASLDSHLCDV